MIKFGDQTMDDSSLMTYNTFTFKTEPEMLLHTRFLEDYGQKFFQKLKKHGCTRFCYNRIWNKQGMFKTSALFEYKNTNAFKKCQEVFQSERDTMIKDLGSINVIVEASRNIVLQDFT